MQAGQRQIWSVAARVCKTQEAKLRFGISVIALSTALGSMAHAEREIDYRSVIRAGGIEVATKPAVFSEPATRRLAYVIGNNEYQYIDDLRNAEQDAKLVSEYLLSEGYQVSPYYDVNKKEFEDILRRIQRESDENTHVLVYFAGHGIQIGDVNYLIPTDAKMEESAEVALEAVSLNNIMEIVKTRSRTLVVFLDSCRDNPFEGRLLRQSLLGDGDPAEAGFANQSAPINSFLAFSTSPGMFAEDGVGRNSPFTSALVDVARERRSDTIETVMQEVRRRVYEATERRQLPWETTSLVDKFLLSNPELSEPFVSYAQNDTSVSESQKITVSQELNKSMDVGSAVANAIGASIDTKINIVEPPKFGSVEAQQDAAGATLVAYRPSLDSVPAKETPILNGQPQIDDAFIVQVADRVVEVQLQATVNECDFEAGDHLDPGGVGISRYANEIDPPVALAACLEAVAQNPDVARFHYQLGRAQTASGNLDAAFEAFSEADRLGHVRAIYGLGANALGRIQEKTGPLNKLAPAEVLAYYAAGAELGDPYAIHALGRQYLLFSEDPVRQEEGFRLLVRAAELGHTFAMNALGLFFLSDGREDLDGARGLAYWRKSAEREDIYGLANMARAHRDGLGGLDKNPEEAFRFYKRATDGGHPFAPTSLGILYATGKGTDKNPAAAVENFDLALERGDARGGTNGAMMFLTGRQPGQVGDAAQRAAKAFQLSDRSRAKAEEQLSEMSDKEIDGGAQAIMVDLGANLTVDGAFGAGSKRALNEIAQKYDVEFPDNRKERLLRLAALFWENNALRVDLF